VAVYGELPVDNNEHVAELEDIAGGNPGNGFCCVRGPFLFSQKDPEFLPPAEGPADGAASATVIFERNGVHYIDDDACNCDESVKESLDGNFARLVESVAFNKGLP